MKVIIATGGTGGHIIPALETARSLREQGHEVVFVGVFRKWTERIRGEGFTGIEELPARGLTDGPALEMGSSVSLMLRSFFRCLAVVRRVNPDVVAGFGGYGAFPAVAAAVFLNRPTLIHEQNVVPGRANRLLSGFVRRIAVSFERSLKYFPEGKSAVTGCPTHINRNTVNREDILKEFRLEPGRKTVLILGGSQGSRRINTEVLKALKNVQDSIPVQAFHISGESHLPAVQNGYRNMGIPFSVHGFFQDMGKAYGIADVVICRAGALSVTEIGLMKKQSVLIPYPHAQNHQKENALVLKDAGVAELIEEKELTAERLSASVTEILRAPISRQEVEDRTRKLSFPDAAQRIAREITEIGS